MLPNSGETPFPLNGNPQKKRRSARISRRIKEIVSHIVLYELKDPRIGFVTILDAAITPDVKEATISLSVLAPPAKQRATLKALNHSKGYIQKRLGKLLETRNTPVLRFEIDEKDQQLQQLEKRFEAIRQRRIGRDAADHD